MNKHISVLRHDDEIISHWYDVYINALREGENATWEATLEQMVINMAERHIELEKQLLNIKIGEIPPTTPINKDYKVKCRTCGWTLWKSECLTYMDGTCLYHVKDKIACGIKDKTICGILDKINV
jgi:hypothetical protein